MTATHTQPESGRAIQINRPSSWFYCTARALGLILFFVYLIIIPIQIHNDIIASMVVYCFGTIMITLAFLIFLSGMIMRRRLSVSIGLPTSPTDDSAAITSRTPALFSFSLTGAYVPPFASLICKVSFQNAMSVLIRLPYFTRGELQTVFIPITFPHRGNWSVSGIDWELIDDLGLWRFTCSAEQSIPTQTIRIAPPPTHTAGAPVINSCIRDGDQAIDVRAPRGDLYDLKRYHPSDGLKKIVWKIFAKSGELLSRHPERTMTPEGKVLILVWANSEEDSACSLAFHYCRYLEDLGLDFAVVCRGMSAHEPAHTAERVESMLIDSAWHADDFEITETSSLLTKLLSHITSAQSDAVETASHIVIIGSSIDERPGSADDLEEIGSLITSKGMSPVFLIASTPIDPRYVHNLNHNPWWHSITSLFVTPAKGILQNRYDHKDFPRRAVFHHWDVHEVMP